MKATFHKIVTRKAEENPDFFFVQIGAKDGRWPDPIHSYVMKYDWHGILVEPVPFWFKRLKETYRRAPNVQFENVAIAERDEEKIFYHVQDSNWYLRLIGGSLGSFYKENILKHVKQRPPGLRSHIIGTPLHCISFDTLLRRNNVQKIDFLVIDTEGYDLKILEQIKFRDMSPNMIFYEHKHLSALDKKRAEEMLRSHGYSIENGPWNTFAWL